MICTHLLDGRQLKALKLTNSGNTGIGASRTRVEDDGLLRGESKFVDDLNLPDQVYATFIRSPYPNATIPAIDVSAAMEIDGAVAVFTQADLDTDGVGIMHSPSGLQSHDGAALKNPKQKVLTNHPRFVGDTVAMVIAERPESLEEIAEAVVIDFEPLDATVDVFRAAEPDSPVVWPEFETNIALDWQSSDSSAVDAAFASADKVARVTVTNNRVVVAALETRGALASFDAADGRVTVRTPTQGGTQVQHGIADPGLGISPSLIRVITPEVGGGFGIKNCIHSEQILTAWAARRLRKPVKWYGSRSDAFISDFHARDHEMTAEVAMDSEGQFLALRVDVLSNMGAYMNGAAPIIPTGGGTRMLANVYRVPLTHARTRCVFTNTAPVSAYRGAGKPEFAHLVETLVDEAARVTGLSPVEIRLRNMIRESDMPWTTPTGLVYDSGDFSGQLNEALRLYDFDSLEKRRNVARSNGKLLGSGVIMYTEPDGFMDNRAELTFDPTGHLTVVTSAQTNGQNHYTTYTQIAETLLGVAPESITVNEGDTDRHGYGSGSGGSRSTTVTGAAMVECAQELILKGRHLAGHLLEANIDDVSFESGDFIITGTDRQVGWREVAALAHNFADLPADVDPGLKAHHHYKAKVYCYPSGCHICEVEIDSQTGQVEITRYLTVSDFGTVINPMTLAGQLHGGAAQGIGQALFEHTVYDEDSGQLVTGSYMDYCIPKADQLPNFEHSLTNTTCTTNPLGVKGVGESGTTAALPAVSSAVFDALSDFDTTDLRMPYTSERVWKVLNRPATQST